MNQPAGHQVELQIAEMKARAIRAAQNPAIKYKRALHDESFLAIQYAEVQSLDEKIKRCCGAPEADIAAGVQAFKDKWDNANKEAVSARRAINAAVAEIIDGSDLKLPLSTIDKAKLVSDITLEIERKAEEELQKKSTETRKNALSDLLAGIVGKQHGAAAVGQSPKPNNFVDESLLTDPKTVGFKRVTTPGLAKKLGNSM